jgi:hypothetical protein
MSVPRIRHLVEWGACAVAVAVAVLTLLVPSWIEVISGADPDAGSGAVERAVTVIAFAVAVALGVLARWDGQRTRAARLAAAKR